MKIKKAVTDKQLAANRRNAKLSTGPRSELGKANSRLNAVTHGLTAEMALVVPRVDGISREEYGERLNALQEEFKPVGVAESECVADIGHAMLLGRRIKSYEGARIEQAASRNGAPIDENPMLTTARVDLDVLKTALAQFYNHGAIEGAIYKAVTQIISQLRGDRSRILAEIDTTDSSRIIIDKSFAKRLKAAVRQTEHFIRQLVQRDEEGVRNYYRSKALLPEAEMKLVILAEDRVFKKRKRAHLTLEYLQKRRKRAEDNPDELGFTRTQTDGDKNSEVK